MKFFIIIAFIAAISNTFFAILVLFKDRKSLSNRLFGLFSLSFALWTFSYGIWLLQNNFEQALFWSRMLNLGAIFIPILILHWILSVLELHEKKRKLLIIGYLITFIFVPFSFSPYFIKNIQPIFIFPYWPQAGFLYTIYLFVCYVGFFSYAFYQMIKIYKKSFNDAVKQKQIQYLFGGLFIGVIGGATNFPLMYSIPLMSPYGMFLIILHPIIFTYAILKYHLFNIKVIATELFSAILIIILFVKFLLSESLQQFILNGIIMAAFLGFSYLLIKSVLKEVKTREEMEELAKELEEANVRLKKLDEAKSEFITIASHQLRSPITAIKGYSSMMLEGSFGRVPIRAKKMLKRVLQSTNRLMFLIDDFLNLSQIERGKMQYNFEKTDLKEMASGIVDEFKTIAVREKKDIEISLKIAETENFIAMVDSNKIQQVFNNLIDNAIKYTEKGFVKINLYADDENGRIFFEVLDSGIGMDKETEALIFQKFTRAGENIFQVHTEGLGLGLYVSKEIIKAHNGKIYAKSDGPGKGSTFFVELPRGDVNPPNTSPEHDYQKHDKRIEEFIKKI